MHTAQKATDIDAVSNIASISRRRNVILLIAFAISAAALSLAAIAFGGDEAIAAGPDQVTVRARGISGAERFDLYMNGDRVGSWTAGTEWSSFSHQVSEATEVRSLEVRFVNDAPGRDLTVDFVDVGGRILQSEASSTRSTGTWAPDGGCRERSSVSDVLHCQGGFTYAVPVGTVIGRAPIDGQELTFRARGTTGNEEIHLRVNGSVVASFTAQIEWNTFSYDLPANVRANEVELAFVNDAADRDLAVDWLAVDGTRYQSEASTTLQSGHYATSRGGCYEGSSSSEWLFCAGWFRYPVGTAAGGQPAPEPTPAPSPEPTPAPGPSPIAPSPTTTAPAPTTTPPTTAPTTTPPTTAAPAPTTTTTIPRSLGEGRFSIAQVIDGTISAGDGSNPNEESPMGRHEAPLALPQGWSWTQGPSRNSQWGQIGTNGSNFVEFRCAVLPQQGHTPSVPFRINVRDAAYYQFANNSWQKGFDVDLLGGNHGAYLGTPGRENQNPFDSGSRGQIQWRREADGSFSAPWNGNAHMMHFWAGQRLAAAPGQTAEFAHAEVRLQQPDGQRVDLSQVQVLFQCGVDYYAGTGGQGTRVPGPGIAKYYRATESWRPTTWVTLPGNVPAGSTGDFARWLEQNPPPQVGR